MSGKRSSRMHSTTSMFMSLISFAKFTRLMCRFYLYISTVLVYSKRTFSRHINTRSLFKSHIRSAPIPKPCGYRSEYLRHVQDALHRSLCVLDLFPGRDGITQFPLRIPEAVDSYVGGGESSQISIILVRSFPWVKEGSELENNSF